MYSKSNGFPRVCAIMIAFVLSDRASSSCATSMLYCGIVKSTKTGTAPYCIIGATVVGKPAATVITSSPLLICLSPKSGEVNVMKANRLADEPEFTREQYLTPKYSENSFSNLFAYLPAVNQNSRELSIKLTNSFSSYTLEA